MFLEMWLLIKDLGIVT